MTPLHRRSILCGAFGAVLASALPVVTSAAFAAEPAAPEAVVRGFYDTLLQAMRQAKELGFAGRYKLLDPVIRKAFDLAAMTRISVGPQWRQIDPAVQAQLQSAFADWTIATYASQFNGFDGEVFAVGAVKDAASGDKLVETTLTPKGAEPVVLNYLMRNTAGDGWRIVDIFLTGTISELATRRSEFTAILKSDGADGLVKALTKRIEDLKK
jgi:phospholipid transport system substrate-binding protein